MGRLSYRAARRDLDDLAPGKSGGTLDRQHVARVVADLAAADAVFTCDIEVRTVWGARYLQTNGKCRLPGRSGMANATVQTIGAPAVVTRMEPAMPPKVTGKKAKGFTTC